MSDDYKEQAPSVLASMVELHRTIAGYRRSYEQGQITWHELQVFERQAEESFGEASDPVPPPF